MKRSKRYSPDVWELAVRMALEHEREYASEREAICSIAEKFGCNRETLRRWVRQGDWDSGRWAGLSTEERGRIKELERENRKLWRANEVLRKASAYSSQAELDRRRR